MNDQHDWRELAAGYALGILDEEERAAFERHLDTASAREADELAAVAGLLGTAVPSAEPPVGLRERILAEAREQSQTTNVAPIRAEEPRGALFQPSWLQLAAAMLGLVALLLVYVDQRRQAAELVDLLSDVQDDLAEMQSLAENRQELLEALLEPEIRVAALSAPDAEPSMRLFWNPRRGVALVTAFNLDAAADGSTYQLWGIDTASGAAPVSLGTFDTNVDGRAVVSLQIPSTTVFDLAAVTLEPAGGSPQPTTTPFLVGNLSTN